MKIGKHNRPGFILTLRFFLFRFFKHLQRKHHALRYFFWESTLRCNLSCIHCGSDCRTESDTPDMPSDDFLHVLERVATVYDPKTVLIAITGGEPLMRQDLEEVGRHIAALGFPWGIVSNGYSLDQGRLHALLEAGLSTITVSLDGLKESHNWMRGRPDAFDRTVRAIVLCADMYNRRRLAFDVVTCVNQRNIGELENLRSLLLSLGVRSWRLFTVFPKGRAGDHAELSLDACGMFQTMRFIESARTKGGLHVEFSCEGYTGVYETRVRNGYFFCRAGINIGSILANGDISACPSLRGDFIQGNIYRDDFLAVWKSRYQRMRDRTWLASGACTRCEEFSRCEGNGLHLRNEMTGALLRCHHRLIEKGMYVSAGNDNTET